MASIPPVSPRELARRTELSVSHADKNGLPVPPGPVVTVSWPSRRPPLRVTWSRVTVI